MLSPRKRKSSAGDGMKMVMEEQEEEKTRSTICLAVCIIAAIAAAVVGVRMIPWRMIGPHSPAEDYSVVVAKFTASLQQPDELVTTPVKFVNDCRMPIDLYWDQHEDESSELRRIARLQPNQQQSFNIGQPRTVKAQPTGSQADSYLKCEKIVKDVESALCTCSVVRESRTSRIPKQP
jgi:hypothetical protein